MTTILLIHPDPKIRSTEAEGMLAEVGLSVNHPDVLWIGEEKLGIEQARQITQFLSLKPFQSKGQGIVVIAAENFTPDAQNALLKTLEEPPADAIIILGAGSDDQLLPTVVSRCQLVNLHQAELASSIGVLNERYRQEIDKLLFSTIEGRFSYLEKMDKREELLAALTVYFRGQLQIPSGFKPGQVENILNDLIEAQRWQRQNVNPRAVLEYLMLKIPILKK